MISSVQIGESLNSSPLIDNIRANGASQSVPKAEPAEEATEEASGRARQQAAVQISLGNDREGQSHSQYNAAGAPVAGSSINRPSSGAISAGLADTKSDDQSEQRSQEESDSKKEAELKKIDAETRRHEQAHKAVLGPHAAGGIQYQYAQGPNGGQFAVGGSVPVDLSPEEDPKATIQKAQTIKRAAVAPAEPSSADRSVAAKAAQLEAKARASLREEQSQAGSGSEQIPQASTAEEGSATQQGIEKGGRKGDPAPDIFSEIVSFQRGDEATAPRRSRLSIRV